MSAKRAPDADPARSLALLWSSHSRPGRSGLTVRAIIEAAIGIADTEGLDAVSMRQVAERLGVGTMSLYTHVPGKAELTDLMVDTAYGRLYDDVDAPAAQPGGWRGGMEFVAARNWDLYRRHPWMLQAPGGRPVLGPNAVLKYEAELRPLDGVGLSDVEMDSVLALVLTHVEGTARLGASMARAQQDSGMNETEWWTVNAPLLDKVMDASRFPVASRVGEAAGREHQGAADPAHALAFGLARILDGVAALIAGR
ncbi:TetR family transcriptional regulator [Planomonospora parontospora subsp. parontospora]|uniref:TetR family transcriptional regulator n=2 Tax=Planomonospora parontospora TaxID=58119 RepID=A0AA37BKI8_9ACTN|nr:TetR/AcrR family transcriptional regulator C-terminal domain-containing protein [Planomonospora parontospora]GGK84926.1 TetR family transcriptional regulator [Planomonospora parontospora]GII10636.1 TetR family transcriptional regulator [Planomonospora parontospora subsp. parontospora]